MKIAVYSTTTGEFLLKLGRLDIKLTREDAKRLKMLLEVTNYVEGLKKLEKGSLDKFRDDMVLLITEKEMEMSRKETGLAVQFTKGHYNEYTLQNIMRLGWVADKEAAEAIANKYIMGKM